MNGLKLSLAFFTCLLVGGHVPFLADRAEATAHCCTCGQPCPGKAGCICCYGCNSGSPSNELSAATGFDLLPGAGLGGISLFHAVSKLDLTDSWQHFMRGSQCVRDKILLRLLGGTDRRLKELEPAGRFDGGRMFR
jgi:hypothetical protein